MAWLSNGVLQHFRDVICVFFSYPPDKRPNFLKLGSATPFEAPWSILVHDWSKKLVLSKDVRPDPKAAVKCPFYVMREPARLSKWQRTLDNLSQTANSKSISNDLDYTESDVKALLPIRVIIFTDLILRIVNYSFLSKKFSGVAKCHIFVRVE